MISAGTIAAYLTLESSDFNRGIGEAMQLLTNLCTAGVQSGGVLGLLGSAAGLAASYFAGPLVSALYAAITGFGNTDAAVRTSAGEMQSRVSSAVQSVKNSLLSIGSAAPAAGSQTRAITAAIEGQLGRLSGSAYSIMSNVGSSLNAGLASQRRTIVNTAAGIADSVTRTLRNALKIASPSKVMRKIGEQTAQGFAVGLDDVRPDITRRADMLAGAVTGADFGSGSTVSAFGAEISALAERLDTLISVVAGGEQTMQVDGRTFARLIREYS